MDSFHRLLTDWVVQLGEGGTERISRSIGRGNYDCAGEGIRSPLFPRVRTTPASDLARAAVLASAAAHGDTRFGGGGQSLPLPSNPSKRHRERLNGELETVASLLPFDESTIQRLDKLSVLRLAVAFLQIKAHFQVCALQHGGRCPEHPAANLRVPLGPVPSALDLHSGLPSVDCREPFLSQLAQKALGAFLMILQLDGDVFHATDNIDSFLGIQQSDVLHGNLFDMIHSEDREELRALLQRVQQLVGQPKDRAAGLALADWAVPIVLRFRCILDNTCGFIRVELRTRVLSLHSHRVDLSPFVPPVPRGEQSHSAAAGGRFALVALCTPFVPPLQMDPQMDDPILKSKHSLDMRIQCLDVRLRQMLELHLHWAGEENGPHSLYQFVHPGDMKSLAEAHESVLNCYSSGLMVYRLVSVRSQHLYFVQSSYRLFFKNGKPDSIGGNHRVLTEVDGQSLLAKRDTLKSKFLSFDDTLLQSPRIYQSSGHSPSQQQPSQLVSTSNKDERANSNPQLAGQPKKAGPLVTVSSSSAGVSLAGRKGAKKGAAKPVPAEGKKCPTASGKEANQMAAGQLLGPYKAEEPGPVGFERRTASGCAQPLLTLPNPSVVPLAPATTSAASLFAAAHQLQNNLGISVTNGGFPSVASQMVSLAQAGQSADSASLLATSSATEAVIGSWPIGGGAQDGPADAGSRNQVALDRCYAEAVVDLAAPFYYCYPNNHPLMDFGAAGYVPHPADYWSSMIAAAGELAPYGAGGGTLAQEFSFTPMAAEQLGSLYWPPQPHTAFLGAGPSPAAASLYPAPKAPAPPAYGADLAVPQKGGPSVISELNRLQRTVALSTQKRTSPGQAGNCGTGVRRVDSTRLRAKGASHWECRRDDRHSSRAEGGQPRLRPEQCSKPPPSRPPPPASDSSPRSHKPYSANSE